MRTERLFAVLLVAAACSTQSVAPAPSDDAAAGTDAAPVTPERIVTTEPPPLTVDPVLRDPFQPGPIADIRTPPQPKGYTVDELRLVAVVTGDGEARAMLVDPDGLGLIVTPGSQVGRAEVTAAGASAWRVDRIRGGKVVLVRDHFTADVGQPATRVLALHHDEAI